MIAATPRHPVGAARGVDGPVGCVRNHLPWQELQKNFTFPRRQASAVRSVWGASVEQRAHRKVFSFGRRIRRSSGPAASATTIAKMRTGVHESIAV